MNEAARGAYSRAPVDVVPEGLGLPILAELVRASLDGIAVLDERHTFVYVNPSGSRILGRAPERLVGKSSPFLSALRLGQPPPSGDRDELAVHSLAYQHPAGSERDLEYRLASLEASGRQLAIATFRDVTESNTHARRVVAFARTASSLAFSETLQEALDRVATEVFHASGVATCAVIPVDSDTRVATVAGTAGLPEDYAAKVEECRRLGAPLGVYQAFESQRPIIWPNWRQQGLQDRRFGPLHNVLERENWGAFVAVPMVARAQRVGVLAVRYRATYEPGEADVTFLTAMADHTAVVVQNAMMLSELERHTALEERHRLARELHDSVSQALFAMTMTTRAVELATQRHGLAHDDPITRGVAELRDLTSDALAEMRGLIFQLRPNALREEGLVSGIRRHAAAVAAREQLSIGVEGPEGPLHLSETTERGLFRLVQEALNNVAKHSRATEARITVLVDPEDRTSLVVVVADDGVGFDPTASYPGHLGLTTMRERIEEIGGQFKIDSAPGGATRVIALVPGALTAPA